MDEIAASGWLGGFDQLPRFRRSDCLTDEAHRWLAHEEIDEVALDSSIETEIICAIRRHVKVKVRVRVSV